MTRERGRDVRGVRALIAAAHTTGRAPGFLGSPA
ncbi:potassium-transporting ATPase subunit C [Microbispora hainanensis]|uniref:Potassium-transporting ATPase subunit C n=1 Tax=Microbispora hainanensis TaxID=568844 RepID=A0ABZ1SKG8_9ACTN|nr:MULTISPECIES: potassium-transporting ATPase subunit C [Microbispora]NJP27601.1 potassium-transporting ATPase subunit C [Microbispora sp. CL1-1]TQS10847.1 potassium-transporting ATPase subunit C [Microbispora sp. SCL1-1]